MKIEDFRKKLRIFKNILIKCKNGKCIEDLFNNFIEINKIKINTLIYDKLKEAQKDWTQVRVFSRYSTVEQEREEETKNFKDDLNCKIKKINEIIPILDKNMFKNHNKNNIKPEVKIALISGATNIIMGIIFLLIAIINS